MDELRQNSGWEFQSTSMKEKEALQGGKTALQDRAPFEKALQGEQFLLNTVFVTNVILKGS